MPVQMGTGTLPLAGRTNDETPDKRVRRIAFFCIGARRERGAFLTSAGRVEPLRCLVSDSHRSAWKGSVHLDLADQTAARHSKAGVWGCRRREARNRRE